MEIREAPPPPEEGWIKVSCDMVEEGNMDMGMLVLSPLSE